VTVRALVLLAHPNPDSFSHAIASRVVATLDGMGHDVVLRDLYAEGFRTAMTAEEHVAYQTDQPVLDPQVAEHVGELRRADTLVFVYPTWWSSVPAILKGWFERVMVPGVGFVFDERGKVRPGITGVRRIVGISTYGSPRWYVLAMSDGGRRTIMRSLRLATGLRARTTWLGLYAMDERTPEQRTAFLARVERTVQEIAR